MVSSDIVDHQINATKKLIRAAITLSFVWITLYGFISIGADVLFPDGHVKPKVDALLYAIAWMICSMAFVRFSEYFDYSVAMACNFFMFVALVITLMSTLHACVSEIDDSEYMNLESRIESAGDDGKMVARSILKPHKKVNGWEYRNVIKELDEIESKKSKMEDSRRKVQEHENAKSSLFKAIYND